MSNRLSATDFTNYPELWIKLKLDQKKIALWDLDRSDLPSSGVDWQDIKYLFVICTGGFSSGHRPLPCNIWYFDATIDPQRNNLTTHLKSLEFVKSHFINHQVSEKLHKIDMKSGHKLFDALLGLKRPHRDFINNWINHSNHKDRYFLSYYQKSNNWEAWQPGFWDEEKQSFQYSGSQVQIPNNGSWQLSHIVPAKIYNETVYSIVAETSGTGVTVPTEKIWKPILARRLFVVVSNQYYLKDLKSLGFKTFDGIIDETYDQIQNDNDRWQAAMQQCDWLCAQDPREIAAAAEPILQHNFELSLNDYNLSLEKSIMDKANELCQ